MKKLNYDYTELDEYFKGIIGPSELDEAFRLMHAGLTELLALAASGHLDVSGHTFDVGDMYRLEELFRILSRMREGGES